MTKRKEKQNKIEVCGNCDYGAPVYSNTPELLVCMNKESSHCGHIIAIDHYSCEQIHWIHSENLN